MQLRSLELAIGCRTRLVHNGAAIARRACSRGNRSLRRLAERKYSVRDDREQVRVRWLVPLDPPGFIAEPAEEFGFDHRVL